MQVLNNEQSHAKRRIETMGPGDRLILTGRAGSGKTYTLARSVSGRRPLFLTPTHPARKVLQSEIADLEQQVMTIHSAIGWRQYRDDELEQRDSYIAAHRARLGRNEKALLNGGHFAEVDIIIVDECSMVGSFLFGAIEEYANEFGLPVVYSGDPYQLPPVGDREVIWEQGFDTLALKESMRFPKESQIYQLGEEIRSLIEQDHEGELKLINDGGDIGVIPKASWDGAFQADYATSASCLAVAYYNDKLQRLRGKVRRLSHDRLAVGDLVMSKKTDERFHNGDQLTIRQISSDKRELHDVPSCVIGTGTLEICGQTMTFAETDTNAFIAGKGRKEAISRHVRDLYDEDHLEHADAVRILDWLDEVNEFELSALSTVHKSQGRTVDTLYVDTETVLQRPDQ
ncbi:AAA family ATPase, partial [Salipiger thiooxidans]|uniref:AAA family ATPase n=1 Tax=Salipiger thiooxidans TaxID=282683 RepID=UPI001A8C8BE0